MTSGERFEMRVAKEWLAMVDLARGGETRGGFVKRVVEGALGGIPVVEVEEVAPVVLPGPGLDEADQRRVRAGLAPLGRSPALERFR